MHRFKEAQVRALEELEGKHQAMREEAQQEKEDEKKLLTAVSPMFTADAPSWRDSSQEFEQKTFLLKIMSGAERVFMK